MSQRCWAYSDGPLQFRYHSGGILTESSAACDHDQKIRLDRFLRWFHSRQHAAAALGRRCHFNFWICFFHPRRNRRNLGRLSVGPVSLAGIWGHERKTKLQTNAINSVSLTKLAG